MRDGAVLPILHLNGYKIANPTVLAASVTSELESLFAGYGYKPYLSRATSPAAMHQEMAATLEAVLDRDQGHPGDARSATSHRPRWPMIVLRTPKGWTGPKEVDGKKVEGSWRSHQVPSPSSPTTLRTSRCSKTGCAATGRRSCSMSRAG